MYVSRVSFLVALFAASLLFSFSSVHAKADSESSQEEVVFGAEQPTLVVLADVNVTDVSVNKDENGQVEGTFTLQGKMGRQNRIAYGLILVNTEGVVLDTVSLGQDVSVKEGELHIFPFTYQFPQQLRGNVRLLLQAETAKGLALGTQQVLTKELSGSDERSPLACASTEGQESLSCTHARGGVVTVAYHLGSIFSTPLQEERHIFTANQELILEPQLPAGRYRVVTRDENTGLASVLSLRVPGAFGTIQSVVLAQDKQTEKIAGVVVTTLSPFPTVQNPAFLDLQIEGAEKDVCSESMTVPLGSQIGEFTVASQCRQGIIKVTLKNQDGDVLDMTTEPFTVEPLEKSTFQSMDQGSSSAKSWLAMQWGSWLKWGLLVLTLGAIAFFRGRVLMRRNSGVVKVALLSLASLSLLGAAHSAQALSLGGPGTATMGYLGEIGYWAGATVTSDKSGYLPGESMTLTADLEVYTDAGAGGSSTTNARVRYDRTGTAPAWDTPWSDNLPQTVVTSGIISMPNNDARNFSGQRTVTIPGSMSVGSHYIPMEFRICSTYPTRAPYPACNLRTDVRNFTFSVVAPSGCSFNGTVNWSGNCSAPFNGTVPEGGNQTLTNSAPGYTGSATYSCNSGSFSPPSNVSCNIKTCTYNGPVNWLSNCSANYSGTINYGQSATVSNTAPGYSGNVTYNCTDTGWQQSGATCAPTAGVVNGACGSAANSGYTSLADLQASGTMCSSGVVANGPQTWKSSDSFDSNGNLIPGGPGYYLGVFWRCDGSNGGSNSGVCVATRQPPVCGSANGNTYASLPSDNDALRQVYCNVGTPENQQQAGNNYSWTCRQKALTQICALTLAGGASVTAAITANGPVAFENQGWLKKVLSFVTGRDHVANASGPNATITAGQNANVTWNSSNAASCSISGTGPGGFTLNISSRNGNYKLNNAQTGTYTFNISCSGASSGSANDSVQVIVSPPGNSGPPNSPGNGGPGSFFNAVGGGCGTGSIGIAWNSVSGATDYELERDGSVINTGSTTSNTHSGLPALSVHNYRVRSHNANGYSSWTGPISATAPDNCVGSGYTITATAGLGGLIAPSGTISNIPSGSNQSFIISADAGYTIDSLSIDGIYIAAANNYTFNNITANHTIDAAFVSSGGGPVVCGNGVCEAGEFCGACVDCGACGGPSGTVSTGPGCTIGLNQSTCNTTFTWSINGATSPNLHNQTRGVTYSNSASGNSQSFAITNGANTVQIRDGVTPIVGGSVSVTGKCDDTTVPPLVWNGTTCQATCIESASCATKEEEYCAGEAFTMAGVCGQLSCTGTRTCDYNWKEVSP